MNTQIKAVCFAVAAIAWFCLPCRAGTTTSTDALVAEVQGVDAGRKVYIGDALDVAVVLRNRSKQDLVTLDWKHAGGLVNVLHSDGEPGAFPLRWRGARSGPYVRQDFVTVPAGQSLNIHAESVICLLPGKTDICVDYESNANGIHVWRDGHVKLEELPGAWTGKTTASVRIELEADMSTQMKARYARAAELLADKAVSLHEKRAHVVTIAKEKHLFAARWVREQWARASDATLREELLARLMDLAEFGTAFEAIPDLVAVVRDEKESRDVRLRVLALFASVNYGTERASHRVGDQYINQIPAGVWKEAVAAVRELAREGSDSVVKAAAEAILKKWIAASQADAQGK